MVKVRSASTGAKKGEKMDRVQRAKFTGTRRDLGGGGGRKKSQQKLSDPMKGRLTA